MVTSSDSKRADAAHQSLYFVSSQPDWYDQAERRYAMDTMRT